MEGKGLCRGFTERGGVMLEGFVKIKSRNICYKHLYGKVGEIFGYGIRSSGTVVYGVSFGDKDYEFYEQELEPAEGTPWWEVKREDVRV